MGGPGGNNPMAFGRSKARFQMEPNTGVTFEDVAGVDEAKQDFMEVRCSVDLVLHSVPSTIGIHCSSYKAIKLPVQTCPLGPATSGLETAWGF